MPPSRVRIPPSPSFLARSEHGQSPRSRDFESCVAWPSHATARPLKGPLRGPTSSLIDLGSAAGGLDDVRGDIPDLLLVEAVAERRHRPGAVRDAVDCELE